MAREEKNSLENALSEIEKQYGQGAIWRLGDQTGIETRVVPTGCLALDLALGIGGLPRGRVTELYGTEGAGKSSLALHVVAEAQKMGENCAYLDLEGGLDPTYAKTIGVDVDELLISQPNSAEESLGVVDKLVHSGEVAVIVIDSVSALVPRAEIEGEYGDAHIALQARLMSQALRKLTGPVSRTDTILLFINQIRENVGVMYGPKESTSGGRALRFYASVRLDIRRIGYIKDGAEVLGQETRVKVVKNRCAPPHKQAEFDIVYGQGISNNGCILDLAVDREIIKKSGAFYSYNDERIGHGKDDTKSFLAEHPEVCDEIEKTLRTS